MNEIMIMNYFLILPFLNNRNKNPQHAVSVEEETGGLYGQKKTTSRWRPHQDEQPLGRHRLVLLEGGEDGQDQTAQDDQEPESRPEREGHDEPQLRHGETG